MTLGCAGSALRITKIIVYLDTRYFTPLEGVFSVHYISAHINPNNTLELYPNPYKFSEWEKWVSKKGQKVGESGRMWYFMVNTLSYEVLLISIFNYW